LLQVKKKFQKESITKVIETEYGTKEGIKTFLEELALYSDLFALIERSENFEGPHKNELNALFNDLNDLNQATQSVFLLAALKRFTERNRKESFNRLAKACRAAEILSFRWLVTGKNAQELEDIWRKSALLILDPAKSEEDALNAALKELQSNLPSNKEFQSEFANRSFKVSKFARYVLKKIENSKIDNEVWVLAGSDKMDVEHVAPKSPDELHDWRSAMDGKLSYKQIIYRIGNQTLLTKSLNRGARNNEYSWKSDHYKKNTGQLTTLTVDLLKNKSWTQEVVLKRSEALAKEALAIWNWDAISKDMKVAPSKARNTETKAPVKSRKKATRSRKKTSKKAASGKAKSESSKTPKRKPRKRAVSASRKS
jgi:hypothetical protein